MRMRMRNEMDIKRVRWRDIQKRKCSVNSLTAVAIDAYFFLPFWSYK